MKRIDWGKLQPDYQPGDEDDPLCPCDDCVDWYVEDDDDYAPT